MARKLLCCTDNLLVLPVCGVFVSLLGLVLLIIYLVARGITSSLNLVEAPIPTYVAALMTIALGVFSIVLLKKRHVLLICSSILLSVLDLIVCVVHAVTAGLVSIPFLGSFSVCVLRATSAECQCYVLGPGNTNSTVIVPGDGTKHYTFQDVKSCGSIETALKDFLYTLCIVYSFGALGCVVTGTLSTLLLCSNRRSQKDPDEQEEVPTRATGRIQQTTHHEDENEGRNNSTQRSLERAVSPQPVSRHGREATTQVTPQGTRPAGSAARPHESRPVRRSASVTTPPTASTAASPIARSGSARPVTAHHSLAGASVESGSRQRPRLPLLVRGGYLQSHVNGPRIPVYTVQGSNEAYIALTDLPKLQLPALDQVPAYVRDLPDLPSYEPPPYSPMAEILSESPEQADVVPPMQSPSVRQRLSFDQNDAPGALETESSGPQIAAQSDTEIIEECQSFGEIGDEVVSTHSLNNYQQEAMVDQSQTLLLGTDDITLHETEQEVSESEGACGIVNPVVVSQDEEAVSEDANLTVDHQPPDILMEAIESARSSMNTTTNNLDASTNVDAELDTPEEQLNLTSNSQSVILNITGFNMGDTSNHSAQNLSSSVPAVSAEQRRDNSMHQRRNEHRSESVGTARHGSMLANHPVESQPVQAVLPNNLSYYNPAVEVPAGRTPTNNQKGNDARSREIKRSRSLSAARNQGVEYTHQESPSTSKRSKRHSATYGRERNYDHRRRAMNYIYAPPEENFCIQYNPVPIPNKPTRDRGRSSDGRVVSRQFGASHNENLSDILNLVETVHGSAVQTSSKKKKKKKPSKKDNSFESRL